MSTGTGFEDFEKELNALVPAFNTATLESEKATLKNAVVAAEQKMNEMVYDIYALTDDERKAVENASINPN